jgi:hypothetical protein
MNAVAGGGDKILVPVGNLTPVVQPTTATILTEQSDSC